MSWFPVHFFNIKYKWSFNMTKIRQVACIVDSGDIEMIWVFKKVLTVCSALKIKIAMNLISVNRDTESFHRWYLTFRGSVIQHLLLSVRHGARCGSTGGAVLQRCLVQLLWLPVFYDGRTEGHRHKFPLLSVRPTPALPIHQPLPFICINNVHILCVPLWSLLNSNLASPDFLHITSEFS